MAYIKFLKEGEKSSKPVRTFNSIKQKRYIKLYQIISIIEGLTIIYLLLMKK